MISYFLFANIIIYLITCTLLDYLREHYFFHKWFYRQIQKMSTIEKYQAMQVSITNIVLSSLGIYLIYPNLSIIHYSTIITIQLLKFICILLISDFMFYFIHRIMHHKYIYKYVHKKHHEHIYTNVWSSFYFSKIELLLTWMFVLVFPILFFEIHIITLEIYLLLIMMSLVKSHSGINIMNIYTSKHHDKHHLKFNMYYGSDLKIWDYLFATCEFNTK